MCTTSPLLCQVPSYPFSRLPTHLCLLLWFRDDDFHDILIYGRRDLIIVGSHKRILLAIDDDNLIHAAGHALAVAGVPARSNPEIDDDLANEHTECRGQEAADDTEQGGDDEETQCLPEDMRQAVQHAVAVVRSAMRGWVVATFIAEPALSPAPALDLGPLN